MESLALRISDLEESQTHCESHNHATRVSWSHFIAAKKEFFELEDKFEAAKFEKEMLLQVLYSIILLVSQNRGSAWSRHTF